MLFGQIAGDAGQILILEEQGFRHCAETAVQFAIQGRDHHRIDAVVLELRVRVDLVCRHFGHARKQLHQQRGRRVDGRCRARWPHREHRHRDRARHRFLLRHRDRQRRTHRACLRAARDQRQLRRGLTDQLHQPDAHVAVGIAQQHIETLLLRPDLYVGDAARIGEGTIAERAEDIDAS